MSGMDSFLLNDLDHHFPDGKLFHKIVITFIRAHFFPAANVLK